MSANGDAEVAVEKISHVTKVLNVEGLIQAQLDPRLGYLLLGGAGAHPLGSWVRGHNAGDEEGEDRYAEKDQSD
jgi:hypothetical protein